jgi:5-methylcytosine-specific restriction endonuclease McrA
VIAHPWYNRRHWRDRLRPAALRKHPFCTNCHRAPSTVADHVIPWKTGKDEAEQWFLFCGGKDFENLTGLCGPCHSQKSDNDEKRQKGAFGQRMDAPSVGSRIKLDRIGDAGASRLFVSSSFPELVNRLVPTKKLNP